MSSITEDEIARAHKRALMDLKPQKLDEFNHAIEREGKSLPFFLRLEGGGDWQTLDDVTSWTCPVGLYEVYTYMNLAVIPRLNGRGLVVLPVANVWLPAYVGAAAYASQYAITGEIGTSGAGDTSLTMLGTAFSNVSRYVTASQGWILSTGDVLDVVSSSFDVRFRRIG